MGADVVWLPAFFKISHRLNYKIISCEFLGELCFQTNIKVCLLLFLMVTVKTVAIQLNWPCKESPLCSKWQYFILFSVGGSKWIR